MQSMVHSPLEHKKKMNFLGAQILNVAFTNASESIDKNCMSLDSHRFHILNVD